MFGPISKFVWYDMYRRFFCNGKNCVCWLSVNRYSKFVSKLFCSVGELPQNKGDKPKMKRGIKSNNIPFKFCSKTKLPPKKSFFCFSVSLLPAFEKKRCTCFNPCSFNFQLNWLLKMIKKNIANIANLVSMYLLYNRNVWT